MRRGLILLTVLSIAATASPAQAGNFEEAVLAYDRGRFEEAKVEFERLVPYGHAGAEAMLGIMYFNGQGVERDRNIAAIYFYKGARRGNADAQLALGSLYINGIGVRANPKTAYKWILLAERGADGRLLAAARQLKARLEVGLSEEDRREARAKADDWRPVWSYQ